MYQLLVTYIVVRVRALYELHRQLLEMDNLD